MNAPLGRGLCKAQLTPSQSSASSPAAWYSLQPPTATQAVEEPHETPSSQLPPSKPTTMFGVLWTLHLVPSHASAKVKGGLLPTTVQSVAEVQDTPSSPPYGPGFGGSALLIVQALPFQNAAVQPPTVAHAALDGHDTSLSAAGLELGKLWMLQVLPFQSSTSAALAPEVVV